MGIPDNLTCLQRNLYAGQEVTVRTAHGTTAWCQIRKVVCQGCILSSCLFNLYAEYIMQDAELDEAQAGIKISGRNIKNLFSSFYFRYKSGAICISEVIDICPGNLDSSLCFFQPSISHDGFCIYVK